VTDFNVREFILVLDVFSNPPVWAGLGMGSPVGMFGLAGPTGPLPDRLGCFVWVFGFAKTTVVGRVPTSVNPMCISPFPPSVPSSFSLCLRPVNNFSFNNFHGQTRGFRLFSRLMCFITVFSPLPPLLDVVRFYWGDGHSYFPREFFSPSPLFVQ